MLNIAAHECHLQTVALHVCAVFFFVLFCFVLFWYIVCLPVPLCGLVLSVPQLGSQGGKVCLEPAVGLKFYFEPCVGCHSQDKGCCQSI